PEKAMQEIRKIHQFNAFTVNHPMQYGLAQYLKGSEHHLALSDFYQEKHDQLFDGLQQTEFVPHRSEGTFFLLASYASISKLSEFEFAQWLTVEFGVTGVPVSAFYESSSDENANHQLIRFCFAKQEST